MRTLTLICGFLASMFAVSTAQAGPDRISFLIGSNHVGSTVSYEEVNPGVFLTWSELLANGNLDFSVGAFRNSYGDGSLAAAVALPIVRREAFGIDVFASLAWYPGNGDRFAHAWGDVVPLAGLQMRYRNMFMQAIPGGGDAVDATLTFGFTFAIN